jgi:hypothetical protein
MDRCLGAGIPAACAAALVLSLPGAGQSIADQMTGPRDAAIRRQGL